MKITTPVIEHLPLCVPVLVVHKESGIETTAILGDREVLFFDPRCISYGSIAYFSTNYQVVRQYAVGEKLIVEMD
jgi:hypothetical protein